MTYTADKVIDVATYKELPQPGESNVIYAVVESGRVYRWMGNKYIEISLEAAPEVESRLSLHYWHQARQLREQIAVLKKNDSEAQAALGIVAAANRRVGYAAMLLFIFWLNGFRYVSGWWEGFFSLFGYTIYLSMTRFVDIVAAYALAILELISRSGNL